MRPYDLESMSTDELWTLHEKIAATLSEKLAAEKTCSKSVFASWELSPGAIAKMWAIRGDLIPAFFRNFEFWMCRLKLGQVAASSLYG